MQQRRPGYPESALTMGSVYAGIFLVAGSVILLQIALTRVFAIMMWHHLTYMVISIAMLGFGAAGSLLTATGAASSDRPAAQWLTGLSLGFGVAIIATFFLATRLPLDTLGLVDDPAGLLRLGLLYLLLSIPFLLGGLTIGFALARYAERVDRLYFFDLVGSALGGGFSVWLLASLGSGGSVVAAAGLALLGAVAFAWGTPGGVRLAAPLALAPLAAGALAVSLGGGAPGLGLPAFDWQIPYAPGKEFARYGEEAYAGTTKIASATAEVEVTPEHSWPPITGGNFGVEDIRKVDGRMVGQDGTAPTMLYRDAANIASFPFLDDSSTGVAYVAREAVGAPPARVLVIGVGGGVDVMVALAHGAAHVTAVEINSAMIEMVEEEFDDYLSGLFRPGAHAYSDRIDLIHGEGRSFARANDVEYDVIQLSGVDSFTALSTGAYTLSEGYVYTVEAVQDFYESLSDGGFIVYSRFIMQKPKLPRETLRLAHIALAALEDLGVDDPSKSILVFQGTTWASTMIKRGPFEPEEVEALRAFASAQGFFGPAFDPLHVVGEPLPVSPRRDHRTRQSIVRAMKRGRIPSPPGDASAQQVASLLFDAHRAGLAGKDGDVSRLIASASFAMPAAEAGAAERAYRAFLAEQLRSARKVDAHFDTVRAQFASLLGGDTEARAAYLDDYPYDVSPSVDDAPFFFNYYKYSGLLDRGAAEGTDVSINDVYHPDYPVGHMVLLASLAQITLIAAVLILLPLRSQRIPTVSRGRARRIFAYFAALGAGFMLIEIVLMQKMVLFLGHPTYAITVVLCGLLAFSGIGSWLSGRISKPSPRILQRLLWAILFGIGLQLVAGAWLLPAALAWPLTARIVTVLVLLLPLGLTLGMPFPLGIRIVDARAPELLPWAWAVNGFLSVFSSIFCIILAMAIGFTAVLALAALTYTAGLLALQHTSLHEETPSTR